MPLTKKQMKIARVAEPRDKITGEDFAELRKNSKADGGIVMFKERDTKRLDKSVKKFKAGMSVDAPGMGRGCGAALTGKKFSGTF